MDEAKKRAGRQAIDDLNLRNGMIIGVGSGSTIVFSAQRLAERVKQEGLDIQCVPTSSQSEKLIQDNGLKLLRLEDFTYVDLAVDGADEVDDNMVLIKGGGACMLQEKVVANAARDKKLIVVADETKKSSALGEKWTKGIPLEVLPKAVKTVMFQIKDQMGGEPKLRLKDDKPVVTDNGNHVVDWVFPPGQSYNWKDIDQQLKSIAGVLETGLFIDLAKKAYFGHKDGTVTIRP